MHSDTSSINNSYHNEIFPSYDNRPLGAAVADAPYESYQDQLASSASAAYFGTATATATAGNADGEVDWSPQEEAMQEPETEEELQVYNTI
jgi:hypothetical protein